MWYGQPSPWMQRSKTPGAGMPPYGQNMPMPMQRPQMPTPQMAQSNVPLAQRQGQGQGQQQGAAMSPELMGMLSAIFATQPQGLVPTAGGRPVPGYGAVTEPSVATGTMTGAAGSPAGGPSMGFLEQLLRRFGSSGFGSSTSY
jgi:hypothetical protein